MAIPKIATPDAVFPYSARPGLGRLPFLRSGAVRSDYLQTLLTPCYLCGESAEGKHADWCEYSEAIMLPDHLAKKTLRTH